MSEIKEGKVFTGDSIEQIILSNMWPKMDCKVCGSSHLAAIRKTIDSREGGMYEFVEGRCPNVSAAGEASKAE
jgi:hypothetical protein